MLYERRTLLLFMCAEISCCAPVSCPPSLRGVLCEIRKCKLAFCLPRDELIWRDVHYTSFWTVWFLDKGFLDPEQLSWPRSEPRACRTMTPLPSHRVKALCSKTTEWSEQMHIWDGPFSRQSWAFCPENVPSKGISLFSIIIIAVEYNQMKNTCLFIKPT